MSCGNEFVISNRGLFYKIALDYIKTGKLGGSTIVDANDLVSYSTMFALKYFNDHPEVELPQRPAAWIENFIIQAYDLVCKRFFNIRRMTTAEKKRKKEKEKLGEEYTINSKYLDHRKQKVVRFSEIRNYHLIQDRKPESHAEKKCEEMIEILDAICRIKEETKEELKMFIYGERPLKKLNRLKKYLRILRKILGSSEVDSSFKVKLKESPYLRREGISNFVKLFM